MSLNPIPVRSVGAPHVHASWMLPRLALTMMLLARVGDAAFARAISGLGRGRRATTALASSMSTQAVAAWAPARPGDRIADVDTPALLLDLDAFDANCGAVVIP